MQGLVAGEPPGGLESLAPQREDSSLCDPSRFVARRGCGFSLGETTSLLSYLLMLSFYPRPVLSWLRPKEDVYLFLCSTRPVNQELGDVTVVFTVRQGAFRGAATSCEGDLPPCGSLASSSPGHVTFLAHFTLTVWKVLDPSTRGAYLTLSHLEGSPRRAVLFSGACLTVRLAHLHVFDKRLSPLVDHRLKEASKLCFFSHICTRDSACALQGVC